MEQYFFDYNPDPKIVQKMEEKFFEYKKNNCIWNRSSEEAKNLISLPYSLENSIILDNYLYNNCYYYALWKIYYNLNLDINNYNVSTKLILNELTENIQFNYSYFFSLKKKLDDNYYKVIESILPKKLKEYNSKGFCNFIREKIDFNFVEKKKLEIEMYAFFMLKNEKLLYYFRNNKEDLNIYLEKNKNLFEKINTKFKDKKVITYDEFKEFFNKL